MEKLYFVGLIAPRGPQIPIYGEQSKLVARMIDLHADAGPRGLALTNYFAVMQDAELRIDIVQAIWNDQMADTDCLSLPMPSPPVDATPTMCAPARTPASLIRMDLPTVRLRRDEVSPAE